AAAHDESALFTEIDDVEGMAQALLRLEGSPELRAKLVQGGRDQLAARFSAERIVDQYLEFFEGLRRGTSLGPNV
ncbi:glycosyltransferase, partial [Agrobacterium cavarae]